MPDAQPARGAPSRSRAFFAGGLAAAAIFAHAGAPRGERSGRSSRCGALQESARGCPEAARPRIRAEESGASRARRRALPIRKSSKR